MTLAGAVAVVVLAPTVSMFFPALGLATGAAAALFTVMLGLALLPVLDWLYPALDSDVEVALETSDAAAPRQVQRRTRAMSCGRPCPRCSPAAWPRCFSWPA